MISHCSQDADLRWSDVNLDEMMITLTDESNAANAGTRESRRLKSGRSRSFPTHSELASVLQLRARQGRYVFAGPRGGRLKPDTVRRLLIRYVLEPLAEKFPAITGQRGFGDGRLHSFRHYFCSTCANDGVREQMLMEWLGHRNSEMVRHYYHLHDEVAKRKMSSIDFLGGAAGVPPAAEEAHHVEEEPPSQKSA